MFRSSRDYSFALGLASGICATLIFILFGGEIYDLVNCISQTECDKYTTSDEHQKEPNWWYWTRRFVEMEDSLAQWIMSVFSVVAVILLWKTLSAANKTNESALAAAQAANTANDILREEGRPWLRVERDTRCKVKFNDNGIVLVNWNYQFINKGKSPALNLRFEWSIYKYDWSFIGAGRQGVEDAIKRAQRKNSITRRILFPSEKTEFIPFKDYWQHTGRITGDDVGTIFLCGCLSYDLDVSGKEQGFEAFALVVERDQISSDPFDHTALNVTDYERIE